MPSTSHRGIRFYRSCDFESLTEAWVKNYKQRLQEGCTFCPEIVLVQSQAMARTLNQALTYRLGITALIEYLLPLEWEARVRKEFLNNKDKGNPSKNPTGNISQLSSLIDFNQNPYDPSYLNWILFRILTYPEHIETLRCVPVLKNYLFDNQNQISHLKAFRLSKLMAYLFNEYLFYREEMLWEWDDSEIDIQGVQTDQNYWQKWLWQTLRQHLSHPHRMEELSQIKEVLKKLRNHPSPPEFPTHISIFGISYLPNYYLELFDNLKHLIAIDYYFPDTTRPWHTDGEGKTKPIFIEKLSELSSTYLDRVEKLFWEEILLPPQLKKQGKLLSYIKSFFSPKILNDLFPEKGGVYLQRDLSLHHCPHPRREVEVVKTEILSLLEKDKDLSLDQILILAPDIEDYRDCLNSVLPMEPSLSYHIIDRNEQHSNVVVLLLLKMLKLFESDWDNYRIRELFDHEVIRIQYDLGRDDIVELETWLEYLGVKKGKGNAPHPDLEKYGWREGIRRMMFHLAFPIEEPSEGKIRNRDLHGERAKNLGKLVYLLQKLLALDSLFQTPASLQEWIERTKNLIKMIYDQNRDYIYPLNIQKDQARILRQMQSLKERIQQADVSLNLQKADNSDAEFDLHTWVYMLKKNLAEGEHVREGSHHGITCGSLLPLRIIPSEITFIMGMGRDQFPRHDQQSHFNLVFQDPRPGDPIQKKRDYLLMIETLFATRRSLTITYSPKIDDGSLSPSVIVDELLSQLNLYSGQDIKSTISQDHPLLPSLSCYFPEENIDQRGELLSQKEKEQEEKQKNPRKNPRYSYDLEDYYSAIARDKRNRLSSTMTESSSPSLKILEILDSINAILHNLTPSVQKKTIKPTVQNLRVNEEARSLFQQGFNSLQISTSTANGSEEILLSWDGVLNFFIDAPKFFLHQVLGLNLDHDFESIKKEEPLILEKLEKYQVLQKALQKLQLTKKTEDEKIIPESVIRSNPHYPPGTPGYNQIANFSQSLREIRKRLSIIGDIIGCSPHDFFLEKPLIIESTLTLSSHLLDKPYRFKVESSIKDSLQVGDTLQLVFCRHLQIKAHDLFRAWLQHLLLHTQYPKVRTWIIGEEIFFLSPTFPTNFKDNKTISFQELIADKLLTYIGVYGMGHVHPLPFYKKLSQVFHDAHIKNIPTCSKEEIDEDKFIKNDEVFDPYVFQKDLDLSPNQPYAYYLWGENPITPLHAAEKFATLYHLLWGELYRNIRRLQ